MGLFQRSAAKLWQGRLTAVTAVIVLAVALWTAGSGLRLGGWWPTPASAAPAATAPAETVVVANGTQTITVQARTNSYTPPALLPRLAFRQSLEDVVLVGGVAMHAHQDAVGALHFRHHLGTAFDRPSVLGQYSVEPEARVSA